LDERPHILSAENDYSPALNPFRAGRIIAYPTETFYGLCADPFNGKAIEALYELKGRPPASPMPLIIGEEGMLSSIAAEINPEARRLMTRFWPGPLTIIFKARPELPSILTAGTGTIGVRLSGSPYARRLSSTLSSPITSTSANPSGRPPAIRADEVLGYFDGTIDILIDGGELKGKKGSTIVDATEEKLVILREGEITASEIFQA